MSCRPAASRLPSQHAEQGSPGPGAEPSRHLPLGSLWHRADRQGVPQRDHAAQLHLPLARVRADGDRVLHPARRRGEIARDRTRSHQIAREVGRDVSRSLHGPSCLDPPPLDPPPDPGVEGVPRAVDRNLAELARVDRAAARAPLDGRPPLQQAGPLRARVHGRDVHFPVRDAGAAPAGSVERDGTPDAHTSTPDAHTAHLMLIQAHLMLIRHT